MLFETGSLYPVTIRQNLNSHFCMQEWSTLFACGTQVARNLQPDQKACISYETISSGNVLSLTM